MSAGASIGEQERCLGAHLWVSARRWRPLEKTMLSDAAAGAFKLVECRSACQVQGRASHLQIANLFCPVMGLIAIAW